RRALRHPAEDGGTPLQEAEPVSKARGLDLRPGGDRGSTRPRHETWIETGDDEHPSEGRSHQERPKSGKESPFEVAPGGAPPDARGQEGAASAHARKSRRASRRGGDRA